MKDGDTSQPLVIIGGHEEREGNKLTILREFARLAGGPRARIVLITAASQVHEEMDAEYRRAFERIGVEDFRALETTSRDEADSAKSVGIVEKATGVFFTGGDQDRLLRILHDTKVAAVIHRRRGEGLVVAGTSAGASMMSDLMLEEGDSAECPRAGITKLAPGMNFLQGVIIDQHFSQRGRMGRLLAAVAERPDYLGVGIGEDTAMVVEGDRFRAIGKGVVTVVDASRLSYCNFPQAATNDPLTLCGLIVHTVGDGHAFDLSNRTLSPKEGSFKSL